MLFLIGLQKNWRSYLLCAQETSSITCRILRGVRKLFTLGPVEASTPASFVPVYALTVCPRTLNAPALLVPHSLILLTFHRLLFHVSINMLNWCMCASFVQVNLLIWSQWNADKIAARCLMMKLSISQKPFIHNTRRLIFLEPSTVACRIILWFWYTRLQQLLLFATLWHYGSWYAL